MRAEIVVSSYRETLKWISLWGCVNSELALLPDSSVIVYRTGDPMEGAVMLENRGREAGQWLTHIVENYDNLADVTFFVQADLGASFGRDGADWPYDLNTFKSFRLPREPQPEFGPIDDYSFYIWPSLKRLRCTVNEAGMNEAFVRGVNPGQPISEKMPPEASFLWGHLPDTIRRPEVFTQEFLGAQHVVTKGFIRRLPQSHYAHCLEMVKTHSLAHWLEFGNWPVFIYDIYRQGPGR